MQNSVQSQAWASKFGQEYTDRNTMTAEGMDAIYLKRYGISRTDMNIRFLGELDRNIRVLEVGSNIGLQLEFLQRMGFKNLYGIEVSPYAVELSKSRTKGINIVQGNALDIPFKDGWFDLVFTSGLLIHIKPSSLPVAMSEIYRCSSHYIWGFEYYAKKLTRIEYRETKKDLLWKANYPELYLSHFLFLGTVKLTHFKILNEGNEDVMFMMRKGNG